MSFCFSWVVLYVILGLLSCVMCEKHTSKVLTIYSPHNPGDLIGQYQLRERLDILGVEKTYVTDYDSAADIIEYGSYSGIGDRYASKNYLPSSRDDDADSDQHLDLSTINGIHVNASDESVKNGQFYLNRKIFLGGHGEIWLGRRILENGNVDLDTDFVLKRMHIKDRPDILRCALREIHFGMHLRDNPRMARYITHFELEGDYWLVFRDEGVSLQSLLYALSVNKGNVLLEPSAIWRSMRSTKRGEESMRSILYQIIAGRPPAPIPPVLSYPHWDSTRSVCLSVCAGVANLHAQGIVHRQEPPPSPIKHLTPICGVCRDVKPSNVLINAYEHEETARRLTRLLIADFSSAVSDEVLERGLYGNGGPSTDEVRVRHGCPCLSGILKST